MAGERTCRSRSDGPAARERPWTPLHENRPAKNIQKATSPVHDCGSPSSATGMLGGGLFSILAIIAIKRTVVDMYEPSEAIAAPTMPNGGRRTNRSRIVVTK